MIVTRPVALQVIPENIPDELKAWPQWVGWRYVEKDGDWTKPPRQVNRAGGLASSTDRNTWSTFEDVLAAYQDPERYLDGIGFCPSPEDPFCFGDFDDCVNGSTLDPEVERLVHGVTYAEYSPSRTGVRQILKGKLPGKGFKEGGFEVYDQGHYLTITGHRLPIARSSIYEDQLHVGRLYALLQAKQAQRRKAASNGKPAAPLPDRIYRPGDRGGRIREMFGRLNSEGVGLEVIVAAVLDENGRHFAPPKSEAEIRAEVGELWERYHGQNGQGPSRRTGTVRNSAPVAPPAATVGVLLSEVEPESVEWLWRGRVAKGKMTLIDGDPGRGKSVLTIDMAARITTGAPWPDGQPCPQGGVVILSAEDGLADTIRPRLDAAGGDPARVVALELVGEDKHPVTLPDDLSYVEAAVRRVEASVVIVDPLMAYLAGDVNSHRDQDVRRALRPLADLADRLHVGVVIVRHLNKTSGGPVIYRGGGSIGIGGAARVVLVVGADPEDDERRVLAPVKTNLSAPPASLAYRLAEPPNGSVVVRWEGVSELRAEQIVVTPREEDGEAKTLIDRAMEALEVVLGDGPVEAKAARREAREATGASDRTIDTAMSRLGVESHKVGFKPSRWEWSLPRRTQEYAEGRNPAGYAFYGKKLRPSEKAATDACPSCGWRSTPELAACPKCHTPKGDPT